MKRALSLFLSFVMLISVFSSTAVIASAEGSADKLFAIKDGRVKDKTITYTINLASGIEGFGGAVIHVEFDSSVLKPVEDECEGTENFSGVYMDGFVDGRDDVYAISYINDEAEKTSTATPFFTLKFEIIDETRPETWLTFLCKEYYSTLDTEESITPGSEPQIIKHISSVSTLEPPKLTGAVLGTGKITLTWEAAEGANGYVIRRQSDDTGREVVAEVDADVFEYEDTELESGKIYTYFVQSSKGDSVSLYDSEGISCKYVAKPEAPAVSNAVGGVNVTWTAVAGADKYVIMRREVYEDGSKAEWEALITRLASSSASYKDINVQNGKTYEYDVNSVSGSFVTDTAEEGAVITYIEAPELLSVVNEEDGIKLSWTAIENASYYIIYRKSSTIGSNVEYTPLYTAYDNFYTDLAVTAGRGYTYTVVAVCEKGESALVKTGKNITRVPSTRVTNMVAGSDNITVSWEAVEGVTGYNIYRKTELSAWEKVGSVRSGALSYKDTSAVSGDEYYYSVAPYIGNFEGCKISSDNKLYYLAAPKTVVDNVKDGIRISWDEVLDADSYELYKKTGESGEFVFVKTFFKGEALSYTDTDVVERELYRYTVKSISDKGESRQSDIEKETMRISCVRNVTVKKLADGVEVDWRLHPDAESYIVVRKDDSGWVEVSQVTEAGYVDNSVVSGKTYAYGVKPVVEGYVGGIDEDSVEEFQFLAAPVLKVTNKASNAVISWNSVGGAKKYEILRAKVNSDGEAGTYKTVETVTYKVTEYVDDDVTAGSKYSYIVYTVDGRDKSAPSKAVANVFLKIPSISKLSNAYGGAKVSWSSVKGADEYRIYRKFTGEKSWTKIATVDGDRLSYVDKGAKNNVKVTYAVRAQNGNSLSSYKSKTFTYFDAPTITLKNSGSGITVSWNKISGARSYYVYRKGPGDSSWKKIATSTKTSYTDKNVKNGKNYSYTIKAYNGIDFSGYKSSGWTIRRLETPKLTSVKNNSSSITVSWGKVSGASSYNVYRKLKGDSNWTKVSSKQKDTSYTDKNVKSGKTYVYTVKAVYSSYTSAHSSSGISIKRLERPELISAKSTKSGIAVRWEETAGASGYIIYRKTASGSWTKLSSVSGNETVKYVDKTAKKGTTYYYTVKATSGSSTSAYYSGLKCKDIY